MKILIAEDNKFLQNFYKTQLVQHGFDVEVADDGIKAMESMRDQKPDLLMLDLIMPNLDGFGVLTELSKDSILKNIPVMVFSTLGQESDVKKAMDLGAKGYVNKSFFDLDKLLISIQNAIQTK